MEQKQAGAQATSKKKPFGWTTTNEGDFVGVKTLGNLNALTREKVLEAVENGRYLLHEGSVLNKIRLGKACDQIRQHIGDAGFRELVGKYWLTQQMKEETLTRELQIAQQVYKFSTRIGAKLKIDIPLDSYLRIASYVEKLKNAKGQDNTIKRINVTGLFNDVEITKTKPLRAAIAAAKIALKNSDEDRDAVANEELKELCDYLSRFGGGLTAKTIKAVGLVPKNKSPSKEVQSKLLRLESDFSDLVERLAEGKKTIVLLLIRLGIKEKSWATTGLTSATDE